MPEGSTKDEKQWCIAVSAVSPIQSRIYSPHPPTIASGSQQTLGAAYFIFVCPAPLWHVFYIIITIE